MSTPDQSANPVNQNTPITTPEASSAEASSAGAAFLEMLRKAEAEMEEKQRKAMELGQKAIAEFPSQPPITSEDMERIRAAVYDILGKDVAQSISIIVIRPGTTNESGMKGIQVAKSCTISDSMMAHDGKPIIGVLKLFLNQACNDICSK